MKDYEDRELKSAWKHYLEIEKSPARERIDNYNNLFESCKSNPDLIGERINWLLNGTYGFGEMRFAENIIERSKNPNPMLFDAIGHFEWYTSSYYIRKAYKTLTKKEQDRLNAIIAEEVEFWKDQVKGEQSHEKD